MHELSVSILNLICAMETRYKDVEWSKTSAHAFAAEFPLQFFSAYPSSSSHLPTWGGKGREGVDEGGE